MDAQMARNIGILLQRIELKGSEVEAFNQIMSVLVEIANAGEEDAVHDSETEE